VTEPALASPALAAIIAKEEIRELALLYCRGVDRKDFDLIRSLYTDDATDAHGANFYPTPDAFVDALRAGLPKMPYTGHHICNHLISVDGDTSEGEIYALAYHTLPDGEGGLVEYLVWVRYLDQYRKVGGRWRFSARKVIYDLDRKRPIPTPKDAPPEPAEDASYGFLMSRLFARGAAD
jgi:hypothetical protein